MRSITLLNIDSKIAAKAVIKRLETVFPNSIHSDQTRIIKKFNYTTLSILYNIYSSKMKQQAYFWMSKVNGPYAWWHQASTLHHQASKMQIEILSSTNSLTLTLVETTWSCPRFEKISRKWFLGVWRHHDKDLLINMTQAWDKEKIWDPDRNRTHEPPNTGQLLYTMSYKRSRRVRFI